MSRIHNLFIYRLASRTVLGLQFTSHQIHMHLTFNSAADWKLNGSVFRPLGLGWMDLRSLGPELVQPIS